MPQHQPSLPTNRAFVVQFRGQTDETQWHCAGRVEHVVSGHASHFTSWAQLRRFIAQVLVTVQAQPPNRAC